MKIVNKDLPYGDIVLVERGDDVPQSTLACSVNASGGNLEWKYSKVTCGWSVFFLNIELNISYIIYINNPKYIYCLSFYKKSHLPSTISIIYQLSVFCLLDHRTVIQFFFFAMFESSECTIYINTKQVASATGTSQKIAKKEAACAAMDELRKYYYTIKVREKTLEKEYICF